MKINIDKFMKVLKDNKKNNLYLWLINKYLGILQTLNLKQFIVIM